MLELNWCSGTANGICIGEEIQHQEFKMALTDGDGLSVWGMLSLWGTRGGILLVVNFKSKYP